MDDRRDGGTERHPQELIPIEEWNAREMRIGLVVKRRPEQCGKWNKKQQVPPSSSVRTFVLFVHSPPILPFAR